MGKLSPTVTSFNFRKSTKTLHFVLPEASSIFGTTNMGEFQGLDFCWITPPANIFSVSEPPPYEPGGYGIVLNL